MTRDAAIRWIGATALALLTAGLPAGCATPFERIDLRTTRLLDETNAGLGPETVDPRLDWPQGSKPPKQRSDGLTDEHPPTVNPSADRLTFNPEEDAEAIVQRLRGDEDLTKGTVELDLVGSIQYAFSHSRDYRFAEEDYLLEALRLLAERHLWGPRFFNDTIAAFESAGDNSLYDSSLSLINDFRVTQRLPYGGQVSAQLLAAATWDLHQHVTGNEQTLDLIFAANIPLLRGAGMVAQEDLIQAERNVIYAARRFERFRREFLVDITTDFLDLVVQLQAIENGRRGVRQFEESEERERALVQAGRQPPFNAALAVQDTLFALDRLNRQIESYHLAVDRFEVRIGMSEEEELVIKPSMPGLPIPVIDMDDAVRAALSFRLDLQNRRDFIADAQRGVNNARNALLADLNVSASVGIPTDTSQSIGAGDFDLGDTTYRAAIALGLPLDRTVERLDLRQAQIDLERSIREYDLFRDAVAVEVRAAVRGIDRAEFSVGLQEENVRVSEIRVASIEAAPDRASARDRSDAVIGMQAAQNDYDSAQRDLQVAILQYLLTSDQLRVEPDGTILPLRGMELSDARAGSENAN